MRIIDETITIEMDMGTVQITQYGDGLNLYANGILLGCIDLHDTPKLVVDDETAGVNVVIATYTKNYPPIILLADSRYELAEDTDRKFRVRGNSLIEPL